MPTKTVAFVKDSIYLDALQYRQSSGRAGRCGFDVQGHVVFVDIPLPKISHLPNAKDSNDPINRLLIALQCSLLAQLSIKHQLIDIQIHFHGLFTLDFLYRLNLINQYGNLIALASLLTHLHYF
ncbi:unnamed protein product [Rotaria sp. Silwood1]|nr:unnamed protein product [Rotaria sp. Silwood1]CAF3652339.1 unnamed protein product [Rotaria sp. Silwood1]CAF3684905.1 unnamed protein product [Rotaria sp. Silwood1]CAF4681933.1 unnamed protein product [Rotaria sp. Silwood1]CAF4872451.1 unnamed protein product [Rotaria sp. Silwood1]